MKRTERTNAALTWRQKVLRELVLIALVGATDLIFGHVGAAFSTVALGAILRRS
jgi:hypothetical protein